MTKTVDVFPFFNELDLLEIRLNELDNFVDYFVITEATQTHSGNEKKLYFKEHATKFQRFEKKIIHQIVSEFPKSLSSFERDWYQRNQVKQILNELLDANDILIYGDVDEIPSLSGIDRAMAVLQDGKLMAHLAQDLYYYYLNLQEVSGTLLSYAGEFPNVHSKRWLGTTLSKWQYSNKFQPVALRDKTHLQISERIESGGYHFSFVGGITGTSVEERIKVKLNEYSHQEFNNLRYKLLLKRRLQKNKDILGRPGAKFQKRVDLNFLPKYILNNFEKFENLILK